MFWTLRNKTEEIQRALSKGNNAQACMAVHELGIRLSFYTILMQVAKTRLDQEEPCGGHDSLTARVLFQFKQDLGMLSSVLKKDNASTAATEIVKILFMHLAALDWSMTFGPTSIIRDKNQEGL